MERNRELLWEPDPEAINASQMTQFRRFVNQSYYLKLVDYFSLQTWSVRHPDQFWQAIWTFTEIIAESAPDKIFIPATKMQDSRWFEGARLNFAENLLRYRDDQPALVFRSERGEQRILSYAQLFEQVSALAAWLSAAGVCTGDRVAGWLPNTPETVIAMLATASLGAIWTACSPDFGLQSLLDRFRQVEPKILLAAATHHYNGKVFQHIDQIKALAQQLPSLQQLIIIPGFQEEAANISDLPTFTHHWQDCLTPHPAPLNFTQLPFNHPLYILYSSGTTGKPKGMVHGAGGTLLQHLKELRLHTDLKREDRLCFYTTCGWMMWHWSVSSLAVGATLVLYEGSPFYPGHNALFNLIDEADISVFGAGAKIFEAAQSFGLQPRQTHSLKNLRTVLTTGSPLLPESFDYIYQSIKPNLCLSSISGGSDIISCFALGNPVLPVYRGELQCLGLGMDVKIFNEQRQELNDEPGELICATAFPSMPVYFWNDPDGSQYQHAYFDRFPNIWAHGDYAKITQHGGLIVYGRSDATLNPGGIRIGSAEIYQQVRKFADIADCLATGLLTTRGEEIILFVTLAPTKSLTAELISEIKQVIRTHTSPHHVPAHIIQAPDLPRTLNGKLMEILVKKLINRQPVTQTDGLANPQSLEFFSRLNI